MKANNLTLVFLGLTIAFSACKKDNSRDEPDKLPAGNYIKFQGVTYREYEWTGVEIESGDSLKFTFILTKDSTKSFHITFKDGYTEGTYHLATAFNGTDNVIAEFVDGGERYLPDNGANGTVIIIGELSEKLVEVHGILDSSIPGGHSGGQVDARFSWY